MKYENGETISTRKVSFTDEYGAAIEVILLMYTELSINKDHYIPARQHELIATVDGERYTCICTIDGHDYLVGCIKWLPEPTSHNLIVPMDYRASVRALWAQYKDHNDRAHRIDDLTRKRYEEHTEAINRRLQGQQL